MIWGYIPDHAQTSSQFLVNLNHHHKTDNVCLSVYHILTIKRILLPSGRSVGRYKNGMFKLFYWQRWLAKRMQKQRGLRHIWLQ